VTITADEETVKLPVQITDANLDCLSRGDSVEGVVRHVYSQEQLPRYGLKFTASETDKE